MTAALKDMQSLRLGLEQQYGEIGYRIGNVLVDADIAGIDSTADLSRLLAEAREIERDGTATGATQAALVAMMEE